MSSHAKWEVVSGGYAQFDKLESRFDVFYSENSVARRPERCTVSGRKFDQDFQIIIEDTEDLFQITYSHLRL